jgi:hypothetical protein
MLCTFLLPQLTSLVRGNSIVDNSVLQAHTRFCFHLQTSYLFDWFYYFENIFFLLVLVQLWRYHVAYYLLGEVNNSLSHSGAYFYPCFIPLFTVLCIFCKRFFGENMDYAHYLSRIRRCSCYHCWIRTFRRKLILENFELFTSCFFIFYYK